MIFSFLQIYSQNLFTNTEVSNAYAKGTRNRDGKPGKNYWQNRGDYSINVNFDPVSNILSGKEVISYYNNSPDNLRKLIIRLYPDFYKKGVVRLSPIAEKDENNGVVIDSMVLGEEAINTSVNTSKFYHNNTNIIVTPSQQILSNSTIKIYINWHYK